MITVTVYLRNNCPQCDEVIEQLQSLQNVTPHQLIKMNVDDDPRDQERYGDSLPVVEVGPYRLRYPIQPGELQVALGAANDRVTQLEKVNQAQYQKLVARGQTLSSGDKISYFLSRRYLLLINLFVFIYVGLPFLAPVLMEENITLPATVIYKLYSVMCHQLSFRSYFLFGEQLYYPRALAEIPGVVTYEQITGDTQDDAFLAREFTGTKTVGYKVALCERDVAIYGFMLIFGLVYGLTGRRFPKIGWLAWIILGLVPIGIDGFSQLPSLAQNLPAWLPIRESTPLLRTITGGLFGWMTAWYLYPMIEESMVETRRILQRKIAIIQQTQASSQEE